MTMSKKPLHLPALDPATVESVSGSGYPAEYAARMGDRSKRRVGNALGLTHIGVNIVTLGPGGQSALRHWHTDEEEFVYMLEGEVVLITNAGEQVLTAGMVAGYPAGKRDAHHFINRSQASACYLEVGERNERDNSFYPDDDVMWVETEEEGVVAAHKDGRRY
jgi:uncharacterized cupin superfamily protein